MNLSVSRFQIPMILIVLFGLLNVYSASMPIALLNYSDATYFFRRQLIWVLSGLALFWCTQQIRLDFWKQIAPILFIAMVVLLVVMQVAGLATVRNGAARWLSVGPVNVQPSEFARPVLVLFLAKILSTRLFAEKATGNHYVALILVASALIAIVLAQPDFGGAILLTGILLAMVYIAGSPKAILAGFVGLFLVAGMEIVLGSAYKKGRMLAFLDPWADSRAYGFQLIQSYLALGNGGPLGRGVGLGTQKLFYLPEAHTDFIFSVIGEEWGLVGTLAVLMLIGWMFYEIYRVAMRSTKSRYSHLVAMGVLIAMGGAYLFNLSVVTGMLPTKGLALPLLSYGGSAMLSSCFALGLVARVDRETAR